MLITRRYEIDMGHCLPDHVGKCYRPHGHRYVVEATISGDVATSGADNGMVMDFGALKEALAGVLDAYDHRFIMASDDPRVDQAIRAFGDGVLLVQGVPTAEGLAELWGRDLAYAFPFEVVRMRVYETPNCWADWCG